MNDSTTTIRPGIEGIINKLNSSHLLVSDFFVDCRDDPLNDTEMEGIAVALSHNNKIGDITFHIPSPEHYGPHPISPASFFTRILVTHSSLRWVDLTLNCLTDEHAVYIAAAMKTNTSLKVIHLCDNLIGDTGFLALMRGLRDNKTLKELHMQNNRIKAEEGVNELVESFEKSSLKFIDLSRNNLGCVGASTIANSIQKNQSITDLRLDGNNINAIGCRAVASALSHNATLLTVCMVGNDGVTDPGVQTAFETALRHGNYTVENLRISYSDNSRAIEALCRQNRRLKRIFRQINDDLPRIPPGLWPMVLKVVECKPDYIYNLLKSKPDLCQVAQRRNSRRRRRTA